jgi:alkylation response protein AidB-like acyl-CoA dehydrogenase
MATQRGAGRPLRRRVTDGNRLRVGVHVDEGSSTLGAGPPGRSERGDDGGGSGAASVAAIRDLAPLVRRHAEEGERAGRIPEAVLEGLRDAGVFRLLVPKAYGGLEHDVATFSQAVQAVAAADGSSGWIAMIGAIGGLVAGALPPATAAEIWRDPDTIVVGPITPLGIARQTADGWVVSGRWPFASGCRQAGWIVVGCIAECRDAGQEPASRKPFDWRLAILPASEVRILDTWSVSGLGATGSDDVEIVDVLVPADRVVRFGGSPIEPGPLYALPVQCFLAIGVASVALGVARAAIEELVRLAATKIPIGTTAPLARRATARIQAAQAEAAVRAAGALLHEELGEAWRALCEPRRLGVRERLLVRLACTNATLSSAHAVELAYAAGGGTANYRTSPLQRHLRDIHAVTQHFSTAAPSWELLGRVLLDPAADPVLL